MNLKVRLGNGTVSTIDIPTESTIYEVKRLVEKIAGETADNVRLVLNGRTLQPNDAYFSEFNPNEEQTLYVVKRKTSSSDTTSSPVRKMPEATNPFGIDSEATAALMNNPLMKNMLSNPDFVRSIVESDPRYQELAKENPEIAQTMLDPQNLNRMADMIKNPQLLQETLRHQDLALSNIESMPGGFNMLSSMSHTLNNFNKPSSDPSTEEANRLMAQRLGVSFYEQRDSPNSKALPNPWKVSASPGGTLTMPQHVGLNSFANPMAAFLNPNERNLNTFNGNLRNGNNISSWTPISNTIFPYPEQLQTLHDMGFLDDDLNKQALHATSGDTDAAVAYILNIPADF